MNILKHIGKRKDSGVELAIVFMKLPDDPSNCLVIDLDSLKDSLKDEIHELINSKDAQQAEQLYEILDKTHYHDGKSYLHALHTHRNMMKLPTDEVILYPTPNNPIVLSDMNKMIDKMKHGLEGLDDEFLDNARAVHQNKIKEAEVEQAKSIAASILNQAKDLEEQAKLILEDARQKRAHAQRIIESTTPKETTKPKRVSKKIPKENNA